MNIENGYSPTSSRIYEECQQAQWPWPVLKSSFFNSSTAPTAALGLKLPTHCQALAFERNLLVEKTKTLMAAWGQQVGPTTKPQHTHTDFGPFKHFSSSSLPKRLRVIRINFGSAPFPKNTELRGRAGSGVATPSQCHSAAPQRSNLGCQTGHWFDAGPMRPEIPPIGFHFRDLCRMERDCWNLKTGAPLRCGNLVEAVLANRALLEERSGGEEHLH